MHMATIGPTPAAPNPVDGQTVPAVPSAVRDFLARWGASLINNQISWWFVSKWPSGFDIP